MARQFRLHLGRQNIRASENSSSAELGRALNSSLQAITSEVAGFVAHMKDVTPDILVEALEPTFGKALEYCPVGETGRLRASGYLEVERYRDLPVAVMGFGRGGNPEYTVYVHEIPATHAPPTQAKWLQNALDEDFFSIVSSLPQLVSEAAGL